MKNYVISVIEGDGIGKQVIPGGIRVLDALCPQFWISFDWWPRDWSCDYHQEGETGSRSRGWSDDVQRV